MNEQLTAVHDRLDDAQRLALSQVARVVAQDKGLSQHRALEHCLEHPEDVAQLAAAFSGLAAALREPAPAPKEPTV